MTPSLEFNQELKKPHKMGYIFWTKGGNSFCRQIFFQAVLTSFSTVLADICFSRELCVFDNFLSFSFQYQVFCIKS